MNDSTFDFTFLTIDQIFSNTQLDILSLSKYGKRCAITDFTILLGGDTSISTAYSSRGESFEDLGKDQVGVWWTKTKQPDTPGLTLAVDITGNMCSYFLSGRSGGARPALPYSSISSISSNEVRRDGILEVEFGEYPQTVVPEDFARTLERTYSNGTINQTGKSYTTDSVNSRDTDTSFQARTHIEYEYNGKKYIRFVGDYNCRGRLLSDGRKIEEGSPYWVEVETIKWIVDEKTNIALSKKIIFSGVQFDIKKSEEFDFDKSFIKKFMDEQFSKDIIPSFSQERITEDEKQLNKLRYYLNKLRYYKKDSSDKGRSR